MKFLVVFSVTGGFSGQIVPIGNIQALRTLVCERLQRAGGQASTRELASLSTQALLDIYQTLTRHETVMLVDAIEALREACPLDVYRRLLCEPFLRYLSGRTIFPRPPAPRWE